MVSTSWTTPDDLFAIAFSDGKIVVASRDVEDVSTIDAGHSTISCVCLDPTFGSSLVAQDRASSKLRLWRLRGDHWHDSHTLRHYDDHVVTTFTWSSRPESCDLGHLLLARYDINIASRASDVISNIYSGTSGGEVLIWLVPSDQLRSPTSSRSRVDNLRTTSSSEKFIKFKIQQHGMRPTRSTPSVAGL